MYWYQYLPDGDDTLPWQLNAPAAGASHTTRPSHCCCCCYRWRRRCSKDISRPTGPHAAAGVGLIQLCAEPPQTGLRCADRRLHDRRQETTTTDVPPAPPASHDVPLLDPRVMRNSSPNQCFSLSLSLSRCPKPATIIIYIVWTCLLATSDAVSDRYLRTV